MERGRPAAADCMRHVPSSLRLGILDTKCRVVRRRVARIARIAGDEQLTANTRCGQQTAWGRAADSERASASSQGIGATLRVCSGRWCGARLAPGLSRSAGRPSVWVSASAGWTVAVSTGSQFRFPRSAVVNGRELAAQLSAMLPRAIRFPGWRRWRRPRRVAAG